MSRDPSPEAPPGWLRRAAMLPTLLAVLAVVLGLATAFGAAYGALAGWQRLDPRGIGICDGPLAGVLGGRASCFQQRLDRAVATDGAGGLRTIASYSPHASGWYAKECHRLMHPIGRRHASRVDVAELTAMPPNDCVAGFLHGMLEQRLRDPAAVDAAAVEALCAARIPWQQIECEHGVGHALMRNTGNDLPTATAHCSRLGARALTENCLDGVFMENHFAALGEDGAAPTRHASSSRIGAQCDAFRATVVAACHAWAVKLARPEHRLLYCDRLTDAASTRACLMAVGTLPNPRTGAPDCPGRADCWYAFGFSQQLVLAEGEGATDACRTAPAGMRSSCRTGALDGVRLLLPAERANPAAVCRMLTFAADSECRALFERPPVQAVTFI